MKLGDLDVVEDERMPPGVLLVGAPEQVARILGLWEAEPGMPPVPPVEVRDDETVAIVVLRRPGAGS